jgi:hypothetical protein
VWRDSHNAEKYSEAFAMPILDTVTHVAGPPVWVGNCVIQRCACCGEKLVAADLSRPAIGRYAERALIQFEPDRMERVVGDFVGGTLPDDFCLALVE